MAQRTLDIVFPAAGVVRRLGLRASTGGRGPFPAPWAMNVRLEDSLTNRLRGGSFTGIAAGARPASTVYRDRLLQISSDNDNVIEASRQGDQTDFDYDSDISDAARPVLFQCALADATGDTVVAMVPHKDAFLLCFTATETWVLQGDPATGAVRRVSPVVGIVGADAWCVAHDTVYFLSSHGLYSVGADGSGLKAISEDKLPEDLTDVSDATATLTYQHSDRGVYLHTTGTDWFYDIEREGFWPFNTGTANSHLLLGPFRLGGENSYGRVLNLHAMLASGSAAVEWHLITGDTAETVAANGKSAITAALAGTSYSSYVASEGTWSADRTHMTYPRVRGLWCCLWLSATSTWAYEGIAMTSVTSGKWR